MLPASSISDYSILFTSRTSVIIKLIQEISCFLGVILKRLLFKRVCRDVLIERIVEQRQYRLDGQ